MLHVLAGCTAALAVVLWLGCYFFNVAKPAPELLKLEGSHVLVTGASSGIGLELCRLCAKMGSNVTMVARNKNRLEKSKKFVESYCSPEKCQKIHTISCDVSSSYEDIEKMFNEALDENGPVNFLISSAGVCYPGRCDSVEPDRFRESIDTNLLGPCLLCKAALDRLSSPARIVLISSQAGQIGIYGYTTYSPAKFGLFGLAQSLQMELLQRKIHITVACPPDTDTPGHAAEMGDLPDETKLISQASGLWEASTVARKILDCAEHGRFTCSFGLNGFLMSVGSNSFCPTYSVADALTEVFLAGPVKAICRAVVNRFYDEILDIEKKKMN